MDRLFTEEERRLLARYVTDTDGDIFAVSGLEGIVGAIYARYSRAPGGFRETLLKEFIREERLDAKRAQDLIERVLIAFGDDSVGELEGAHMSFENISILATKEIEDRRIGGSPIEQSTRYVFYDQRDQKGCFRYYRDPEVMESDHATEYVATMDFIFGTYCDLIEPMQEYYRGLKPLATAAYDIDGDGETERLRDLRDSADIKAFRRTYKTDIRTRACDTLRYLLPIATRTNVGVFGNGRFFQNVLSHCYSHPLPEVRAIAERGHAQLDAVMPRYVKRARPLDYVIRNRARMVRLAAELFRDVRPEQEEPLVLLDRGEDTLAARLAGGAPDAAALRRAHQDEADCLTISLMLYPYLTHPLRQIRRTIRVWDEIMRRRVIETYVGERQTRRDRPGRAFEGGYPYTFDLLTDFGTYKDLMRHRMSTQLRQRFTPLLGFSLPPDLKEAGFADRAEACRDRAMALYRRLTPDFPEAASYATLHGSLVRWVMGINDRSLHHLIELRTTPQGHPSYRQVAQAMYRAVKERSPWRAEVMRFTDHDDYSWSRAASEARQRAKERELDSVSGAS